MFKLILVASYAALPKYVHSDVEPVITGDIPTLSTAHSKYPTNVPL